MRSHLRAFALLLALSLLAGCGGDETLAGVDVAGDIVTVTGPLDDGDQSWLQLPGGRLTFTVTKPVSVIPADESADARQHTAGPGRAFVGVDWSYVPGEGVPGWLEGVLAGAETELPINLATLDTTYSLGVAARGPDTTSDVRGSGGYLLVDGDGLEVELSVDLEGVTQTVDARSGAPETGRASVLYELPADTPPATECTSSVLPAAVRSDLACGWWSTEVPYVAGLGWANESWTLVHLTTTATVWAREGSAWQVRGTTDDSHSGEHPPVKTIEIVDETTQLTQLLVWSDAIDVVSLRRTLTGALAGGTGPGQDELVLTTDLALG